MNLFLLFILRGAIGSLSWLNFFFIVSSSNKAGVSVSVVFSLGTGTSFLAAIAFYFIYKEKLK